MKSKLSIVALLACSAVLPCAAAVNKCTDAKGRVTFQDGPCPSTPPEALAAAAPSAVRAPASEAKDNSGARGAWRGPAQLLLVGGAAPRAGDAPLAAAVMVELESDGRVRGNTEGAGCRLLGVHAPGAAPSVTALDVNLTGCRDPRFNARYAGQLQLSAASKEARLTLQAPPPVGQEGKAPQPSIEAVLRR